MEQERSNKTRQKLRRRLLTQSPEFKPGQRIGDGSDVHGGGGPENFGARDSSQAGITFYQTQPSWAWERHTQNEYFGYARQSRTPDVSGMPSNNFRGLGDIHGGRQ